MRAFLQIRSRWDDSGVALILAMVFVVALGIVFLALGSSVTGGLINSNGLSTQRNGEYAAEAATTVAAQTVRYSGNTFSTAGNCMGTLGGPIDIEGASFYVDCTQQAFDRVSGITRVINFYACSSLSCTASNAIVAAQITFDDYSFRNDYHCTPGGDTSTCGSAQSINSWIVETGNH